MIILLAIVFTLSFSSCCANNSHDEDVSDSFNLKQYFCPQNRSCLPSFQRCTPDEVCKYEGLLDKCLKVYPRDTGAHAILIGRVRI